MKLSEYLDENGISQKFFASKLGYTPHYLNMVIRGRRGPSKQLIKAVNKYIASTQKNSKVPTINIEWEESKQDSEDRTD